MTLVVVVTCARAVTRLADALAERWLLSARAELARLQQAAGRQARWWSLVVGGER